MSVAGPQEVCLVIMNPAVHTRSALGYFWLHLENGFKHPMFNSWAIRLRNDVQVFTNQLWYTWKRLCNHWCAIIFIVLWLLIWMHATISLLSDQTREIIHLALSHTHRYHHKSQASRSTSPQLTSLSASLWWACATMSLTCARSCTRCH